MAAPTASAHDTKDGERAGESNAHNKLSGECIHDAAAAADEPTPHVYGWAAFFTNACAKEGCVTNAYLLRFFTDIDKDTLLESAALAVEGQDDAARIAARTATLTRPLSLAPRLVRLDFSQQYLGDKVVAALCTVLSTALHLRALALRDMRLGACALQRLADTFKVHRGIQELDVSGSPVYATTARRFWEMLKHNTHITKFFFSETDMPDRCRVRIWTQLTRNVAAAFPLLGTTEGSWRREAATVVAEAEATEDPAWRDRIPVPGVAASMEAHRASLLRRFRVFGLSAAQLHTDLGSHALDELASLEERLLGTDGGGQPDGLAVGLTAPYSASILRCLRREHGSVERFVGPLLGGLEQHHREILRSQLEKVSMALDADDAIEAARLMAHVRGSVGLLARTTSQNPESGDEATRDFMGEVYADCDALKALHTTSRELILLHTKAKYLRMDFPKMTSVVRARAAGAVAPARAEWRTLVEEHCTTTDELWSQARYDIVAALVSVVPPRVLRYVVHCLCSEALESSKRIPVGTLSSKYRQQAHPTTPDVLEFIEGAWGTEESINEFCFAFSTSAMYHRAVERPSD